jgi:hypothetical protein
MVVHMIKYLLLTLSIVVLINACSEKKKQTLTIPRVEKKHNIIVLEEIKVFQKKPIAMVLHGDTIYHCSNLSKGACGISAECGEYQLNCLKNPIVEYLP